MIKALRKRHFQIWSLIAVLIPTGIIAAWIAVSEEASDSLLQPGAGHALPVMIKSIEKENYTANLKSNSDHSQYQLEWINKRESVFPSSLVYKITFPENELIGRVDAMGVYFFPLRVDSMNAYNFILYEIIKNQVTDSLNFGQ